MKREGVSKLKLAQGTTGVLQADLPLLAPSRCGPRTIPDLDCQDKPCEGSGPGVIIDISACWQLISDVIKAYVLPKVILTSFDVEVRARVFFARKSMHGNENYRVYHQASRPVARIDCIFPHGIAADGRVFRLRRYHWLRSRSDLGVYTACPRIGDVGGSPACMYYAVCVHDGRVSQLVLAAPDQRWTKEGCSVTNHVNNRKPGSLGSSVSWGRMRMIPRWIHAGRRSTAMTSPVKTLLPK